MRPDRKRQQHCSDCGTWIGEHRSKRNEAVCDICADSRRIRHNEKMKYRPVKLHSSLMPLFMDIAQTMAGVEYVMIVETYNERIVVRHNDETEQIIFPF